MNGFDTMAVSDSEMAGVITSDEQPAPETPEAKTEPVVEPTEPVIPEALKYKIGDVEYDEDALKAALADSQNKANWQKSNTEEAQRLATQKKEFEKERETTRNLRAAVEPITKFIETLKGDEDIADIREQFVGRYGAEMGKIFDSMTAFDPNNAPNPWLSDLENVKSEFEAFKAEQTAREEANKFLAEEMRTLRTANSLDENQAQKVLEFANQRFVETGEALTLDAAYKLMNYDKMKADAEEARKKKIPEVPKIPVGGHGAKTIETKKPNSFEDIDIGEVHLIQ